MWVKVGGVTVKVCRCHYVRVQKANLVFKFSSSSSSSSLLLLPPSSHRIHHRTLHKAPTLLPRKTGPLGNHTHLQTHPLTHPQKTRSEIAVSPAMCVALLCGGISASLSSLSLSLSLSFIITSSLRSTYMGYNEGMAYSNANV